MARNSALTNAHSGRRMVFITIGALVIITIAGALFIFHSMRVGSERWALKLVDEPSPIWGALHQTHPTAMRIKLAFVTDYDGADASTLTETAHAFNKRLLWKSLISKRAPESTLMLYIPAQSSSARSLSWLLPSILPTLRRKLTSLKTTSECHLVICPASGVDRWTFIPRKPLMKLQGRSEEYSRQKTWYAHLRATSIKPIATIQTSLHQLPDCPADYSSVDTIWLSHSQLWRLTRAQLNALNAWLYGGGVLVLDATRLDERSISLVQRLWNLRILGKGAMVSPQVLGDALPTSVRIPPVRYPTVKVALKDNWEVALAEGRTPLVIERKFGYGRIIALLMDALSATQRYDARSDEITAQRLGQWLVGKVRSYMKNQHFMWGLFGWIQPYPSVGLVMLAVILVALLLLFIPRFFLALNHFRKGWFTAITIAIVVSVVMLVWRTFQGEMRVAQANLLMLQSGSRVAGLTSILRLHSANRRIGIWCASNALRLIPCALENAVALRELPAQGISKFAIVGPSNPATAVMNGMVDVGGPITASVKLRGYRWHVRMRNDSRLTLRDIMLVLKNAEPTAWWRASFINVAHKLRPGEHLEVMAKGIQRSVYSMKYISRITQISRVYLHLDENILLVARCITGAVLPRYALITKGKWDETILLISPRIEPSQNALIHPSELNLIRSPYIASEGRGVSLEHDWSWRVHFKTNVKISYVQMPIKLRGIDDVNSLERITFTLHSVKMGDGVNVKIYAYNFKACAWQALPKVYTAIEQKSWCIYCPGEYIHPLTHEVWIRMRIYAETAGEAMRWQYIVVKAYLRGDARDEHAE